MSSSAHNQIRELYKDHGFAPDVYKDHLLATVLAPENIKLDEFVQIMDNGKLIGMARIEPDGNMTNLTVHSNYRRRGIGRDIVNACRTRSPNNLHFNCI